MQLFLFFQLSIFKRNKNIFLKHIFLNKIILKNLRWIAIIKNLIKSHLTVLSTEVCLKEEK